MEDDAQTENITNRIVFFLVLQIRNLRCHITRRSTSRKDIVFRIYKSCQPEISDNTLIWLLIPQYDILRLQIPMHYSFFMHCWYSLQEALHDSLDFIKWEFVSFFDLIKEYTTTQILDTHIEWILCFIDSLNFHQVFMVQWSHDINLVFEGLFAPFFTILYFFRKCLDCIFGTIMVFEHKINWGKITLTNFFDGLEKYVEIPLV